MAGQWQGGQWRPEENVQPHVQQPAPFPESPGQYGQQPYQGQYPPPPQFPYPPQYGPPPRKSRKGLAAIGCLGAGGLLLVIIAVAASHPSSSSSPGALPTLPTVAVSTTTAQAAAKGTVTYEVTGSPADVTYGPAGSNYSGTVPLSKTGPLGSPVYYAISAQLQGGGTVTCKILIDGKVISRSTASGSYNIADCEVSRNPLSGQWEDTNGS